MLNIFSYLQTIYNFFILSPLSVIIGLFVGGIIGFSVKLPKSGKGLMWLFIFVCFSPVIGRNFYLVKSIDLNILLSALLFSTSLTVFVVMVYRYFKLDQIPYQKKNI